MIEDVVIIIPAYNPDEKFICFLKDLTDNGYEKIICVDDGSKLEAKKYFTTAKEDFGCVILTHSVNLGQGRAYKTGFNYYLMEINRRGHYENSVGVIQCDCDGQHCIEDINRCAELIRTHPDKFILGVRDFSDGSIPFRSRFGNNCTSLVFKFFCGLDIKDTQSGLKGIPKSFIPVLMGTSGERFEYASSVLLETKNQGIEILQFPIRTIYINGNETSHFNPLVDSIRIYSLILKYLISSLSAFIVDIVAFTFFLAITKRLISIHYIIVSTYLAKIISCSYTFFVNKNLVFKYKNNGRFTAAKFVLLCIGQATLSGFFTDVFVRVFGWNEILSKIIIDTLFFFISFQVQNRWVFERRINGGDGT